LRGIFKKSPIPPLASSLSFLQQENESEAIFPVLFPDPAEPDSGKEPGDRSVKSMA
jgi:hypothetical protein